MPVTPTFPGVYIEELPSGVRTITGVSTSIAAFIGRAPRGPVDRAVVVTSYDDFVRNFGDLDGTYPMGFAVRDFYLNGGTTAVIVRIFKAAAPQLAQLDAKGLALEAAAPGAWANTLRVRVTRTDPLKLVDIAAALGVAAADLFNLTVHDTKSGVTERYNNVTGTVSSSRQVTGVLQSQSAFVRTKGAVVNPATPAHTGNDTDADVWTDVAKSTAVTANVNNSDALAAAADYGTPLAGGFLNFTDFNLLCIPPDTVGGDVPTALHAIAAAYCTKRRAFYIVDPPVAWAAVSSVTPDTLAISGDDQKNAALYFPRLIASNPTRGGQPDSFVPSGAIAGIMARTDITRGVWKAPAGVDASITGALGLTTTLSDEQNGLLNPIGVNCLRTFPIYGNIVWGARTMRGADVLGSEWKYVPVRRVALFIEESLFRGLKWVVFEPNDEPLWAQIRLNVGAFMQGLFRQGAFQGTSARDAYFVKCDKDTTTQNDINLGIVNVIVGFAPLKPAEFVIIKLQQMAGQIQT
jgi:uncharacterized protein